MENLIIISLITIFFIMIIQLFLMLKIYRVIQIQRLMESETMPNRSLNDNHKQPLVEEVVTAVLYKLFTIRNAVDKQTKNIHVKAIERAPKTLGLSEELISQAFSANNKEKITVFLTMYNQYIQKYWLNKNHQLKTVFSGDVYQKSGDVGKMILASEQLVKQLDSLLEEIQTGK